MSVNKAILIGNVGRDPEIRYMAENKPIASFSLATTERAYTTAAGVNVPEKTEWHNIVMWGKNAEFAEVADEVSSAVVNFAEYLKRM